MKKDIPTIKKKALPLLQEAGVVHSELFGSAGRGEMTNTSDIDFLVEFKENKTLLDLVGLKEKLETALQSPVDLVTYNSISPLIKQRIQKDRIRIL